MLPVKSIFLWLPRILTILFILFISIFALDVFQQGRSFWKTTGGLFMHLRTAFILLGILYITWKWEKIGGFVFIATGIWFIYYFHMRSLMNALIGAGPLFLIGILFLVSGIIGNDK